MKAKSILTPIFLLALLAAAPADAQHFKELIEQGEYVKLGEKLEPHLDLDRSDDKLKAYLQMNLDYLARNAQPRVAGSEIILVRGARNDRPYRMANDNGRRRPDDFPGLFDGTEGYPSGGPRLMLPNRIRFLRRPYDERLPFIDRYFREATTDMGADGNALRELEKIIQHHAGGGLGVHANSTASVLISASTRPLWAFGPPYYIIKVAPERCIFNYKGLSGEFEVLLPFWVLPHEIVARCDSRAEVENHPAYQGSLYKDLEFFDTSSGTWPYPSNWEMIEENIREGRPPLPINPLGIQPVSGEVEVNGSRVFIDTGSDSLRVRPRSTASHLKKFEGRTVRLRGIVDSGELTVRDIISPKEETRPGNVSVDGDDVELTFTDMFETVTTQGTPVRALRALDGEEVRVRGWVFTDAQGYREHIYLNRVFALSSVALDLSRPNGTTLPAGEVVEVTYVTSSGTRGIFKHADGWGWTDLSDLDFPGAVSQTNASSGLTAVGN